MSTAPEQFLGRAVLDAADLQQPSNTEFEKVLYAETEDLAFCLRHRIRNRRRELIGQPQQFNPGEEVLLDGDVYTVTAFQVGVAGTRLYSLSGEHLCMYEADELRYP